MSKLKELESLYVAKQQQNALKNKEIDKKQESINKQQNMGLFFWDYNDYNDTWREWICFVLNGLVFGFTLLALIRSVNFHRKITFETLPLTFNIISTLVLLLLKLFQKGYEFDLIGYLIQIFTYFLFAFTFGIIFARTKKQPNSSFQIKACMITFILIVSLLIVLILLVAIKVIDRNCDRNLVAISVITLGFEIVTYVPAMYNGKQLLEYLNYHKKSTITETILSSQVESLNTLSDQFTIERKKQVFTILAVYTLSLFIRVILLIVSASIENSDLIECQQLEGIYIITSDYFLGQLMLIMIEINQLLPHIIIPLAVLMVPMKTKTRKLDFGSAENFSLSSCDDESDQIDSRDEIIKSKVSSVISDRSLSPKRR